MSALTISPDRSPGFGTALRGEFMLTRARPAPWVSIGVWALCIVAFAYLVSYLTTAGSEWYTAAQQQAAISAMLPAGTAHYILASLPLYAAPQFVILGAILGASDYARGTLRTIVSRFPERAPFIGARLTNLAVIAAVAAGVTLATSMLASVGVALVEDAAIAFPPIGNLARALLAIWLVAATFIAIGFALGTVTRSVLAAVAIGAGWTLGIESLAIGMMAPISPAIEAVQGFLPVGAAASLAAGMAPEAAVLPPPVTAATSPGISVAVLLAWALLAISVAASLLRRRDLA